MLCVHCKKNQATKTYERLKNGKREIEYYCLQCYHNAFLNASATEQTVVYTACPYCGTTASDVKKRNLVGCAFCYTTLAYVVAPLVQKMQGNLTHSGKTLYVSEESKKDKRCMELEVLAKKCYAENDGVAATRYEEQISRLSEGYEEEYVWDNRLLSKQS